ncbi:MAG TPA: SAM-dependent methyltransferase [Streptosporangiaceae bacterium]|nr:SAM-dependent methyltransferase [Streptosporangiaceae bacterium]
MDWVQQRVGTDRASIYRVYDCLLGGTDNLAADREVFARLVGAVPDAPRMAMANRAFLRRVVCFLAAEAGISRFLDIGSGLSASGNVHQVTWEAGCPARVLYVDDDPDVVARSRALLSDSSTAAIIKADLHRPEEILASPEVRELLAPGQPVALTLLAVLPLIDDEDDPAGIVALLREAMPPGSYLAISHFRDTTTSHPTDAARIAGAQKLFRELFGTGNWRSHEEVLSYFGDLEMVDPGLVPLPEWRPSPGATRFQYAGYHAWVGGVARKR